MTPEAQQIAIAKARYPGQSDTWYAGHLSNTDYLSDLNAMHEAEKVLTKEQHELFIVRLYCITTNEGFAVVRNRQDFRLSPWMVWFVAHATATQRAEAFLRTLYPSGTTQNDQP